MSVLLLRLAGPLQAWGDASRFSRRMTRREPTKSGILGMLASAQGRRRTDPIEDLLTLRFGVRTDQPGRILRDFQTARTLDGTKSMPLSERYYITDGVFVAGVEGDDELIEGLGRAVQSPQFPLYLGRRSCVPSRPVFAGIEYKQLEQVLTHTPWQASEWFQAQYRRQGRGGVYRCQMSIDYSGEQSLLDPGSAIERTRDEPLSWDPRRREYGWREVLHSSVEVACSSGDDVRLTQHDPWREL